MADYELLERLCGCPGISGREDSVRELILREITPYCACVEVDRLGNIIALKKGKRKPKEKLMLAAHMDEVGLIITRITEEGYLHFTTVGGIDSRVLPGIQVKVGKKGIHGVIGSKAIHFLSSEELKKPAEIAQMYIDIGASSREEAEKAVVPGDEVVFFSEFYRQERTVVSKALDDRAGCAVLIELIRRPLAYDMFFVFSVQEEIGTRGIKTASFAVAPSAAIVVEATTAADIPGVPAEKKVCYQGKGPVISFMDGGTIYDRRYFDLALSLARENGIPCQIKEAASGGNDAGSIHCSREGVRCSAISLPCRYLHAPFTQIREEDYEEAIRLVEKLAEAVCDSGEEEQVL